MYRVIAFVCALGFSAMGTGLGSFSTKAMLGTRGDMNVLSPLGMMRTAKDTVVVTGYKSTQFLLGDTIVTIGSITERDPSGRPLEFLSEMIFMGDTAFSRAEYDYSADGKTVIMTSQYKESDDSDWAPEMKWEIRLVDASHFNSVILYQEMKLYTWDEDSEDWVLESHEKAEWTGGTVDCPELITETTLDTATGIWVESGRRYPVCNLEGSLSTFSIENIDDLTGAWFEFMRYTYSYNDEGRLERVEMEMRMDPTSEMEHFMTTEYTYGTISLDAQPSFRNSAQVQAANYRATMYDLRGRRIEDRRKVEFSGASARLVRVSRDGVRSWKLMPAVGR